ARREKVGEQQIREWPVFKRLREEEKFQEFFRKTFKSELIVVPVAGDEDSGKLSITLFDTGTNTKY
ncbi:hypothetical protein, partial [Tardiphaga sp.]|uniref:hypothetical protein n=1 Tax=Tardiphaga sp. TaxID=1926292 RepID=UPI0037DA32E7